MTKNEKISATLKQHFRENGHHNKSKEGWKHSAEMKELKRQKSIEYWDKRGRLTQKQKNARNVAGVVAYRARQKNAITESSDLTLIKKIYENCPDGFHVDHIEALASGGKHHQDNLQYLQANENCKKGKSQNYDQTKALDWRTYIIE
tara:strand:- start:29 stop:469 length:441 start_codon:yes stop_codon:yes gene_type:complete